MAGIERIKHSNVSYNVNQKTEKDNQTQENLNIKTGKISSQNDTLEKITYKKTETVGAIKRPLKIDKSNNIFYVNYHGDNKSVSIEPGEYNLTELRHAIQHKVNEKFGIGIKIELTGSGSDRLIRAQDRKLFDFLV